MTLSLDTYAETNPRRGFCMATHVCTTHRLSIAKNVVLTTWFWVDIPTLLILMKNIKEYGTVWLQSNG